MQFKTIYIIFSMDLEKKRLDLEANIPVIHYIGHYDITGRILSLPIVGNGDINVTFGMYFIILIFSSMYNSIRFITMII